MNADELTVKDLVSQVTADAHAPHSVVVSLGECVIRIASNSEALVSYLAEYYRFYVDLERRPTVTVIAIEGPPPRLELPFAVAPRVREGGRPKEESVDLPDGRIVRKVRTGMLLAFNPCQNLAVGACLENSNQVVNFINSRYLDWHLQRGAMLLHAAGVAYDNQGVALAAPANSGKSTLALHFLERGFSFVSNDRIILNADLPGLRMLGLPKHPRVHPGTLLTMPSLSHILPADRRDELAALPSERLWRHEEKYDVDIGREFGPDRHTLMARLCAVAVLNWQRTNAATSIRQVDLAERRDLLPLLMKSPGLFIMGRAGVPASPEDYVRVLAPCSVYEVSGGIRFDVFTDTFREMFGPGRSADPGQRAECGSL